MLTFMVVVNYFRRVISNIQAAFVQADADHDVICPSYTIADLLPAHRGENWTKYYNPEPNLFSKLYGWFQMWHCLLIHLLGMPVYVFEFAHLRRWVCEQWVSCIRPLYDCICLPRHASFYLLRNNSGPRSHNCDAAVEMGVLAHGDTSLTVREPPRANLFEIFHGSICFLGVGSAWRKGPESGFGVSDKDNDNWFIGLVYSLHAVMDYYRYVYTLLQVGTVRPGQLVCFW